MITDALEGSEENFVAQNKKPQKHNKKNKKK